VQAEIVQFCEIRRYKVESGRVPSTRRDQLACASNGRDLVIDLRVWGKKKCVDYAFPGGTKAREMQVPLNRADRGGKPMRIGDLCENKKKES